jgi:glycerophosphoryl diester phosphodiesterase
VKAILPPLVLLALLAGGCALVPRDGPGRTSEAATVSDLLFAPDAPRHLVCGHRGAFFPSALGAGVNTLESFDRARRAGADLVETDVRTTRDRVPVIAHDVGPEEASLEEWRARGKDLLTLRAALQWANRRVVLLLDVKTHDVPAVARAVREANAVARVLFLAGGPSEYAAIRGAGSDLWVVVRARKPADVGMWRRTDDPRIAAIHGDAEWMSRERIERIHASGKKVWVNAFGAVWHQELFGTRGTVTELFHRGVDIVHTNVPSEAAHARRRLEDSDRE